MVGMNRILLVATVSLVLVASSVLLPVCECAKKPEAGPRKEDVPYIKCQVCEKLASQLHQQVKKKQEEISPKKISEYQIIEIAENVCDLKKEEADWILKIDIVENGDKLELVEQDAEGFCNSECKTIESACHQVIGYTDTDVAEYIYKSKPELESLVNYLCKDVSDACTKNIPPVPKDRVPGESFKPKPTKELEMDKMMKSMQGIPGAPGMKVFSREDLEKYKDNPEKLANMVEDDDDDDEEQGNFANNFGFPGAPDMKVFTSEDLEEYKRNPEKFTKANEDKISPKKVGRVSREKKSKKEDWKEKITKEIKNTGDALKRRAFKVSNRVGRWWKGLGSSSSSKKTKTGKSEL